MKKILLASVALTAFAGAAAAEVSFSGSAVLGYNDTEITPDAANDDDFGFYSELNLDVTMSATLDNGITVSASADVDELDATEAAGSAAGVTLTISSANASLVYGDTTFASEDYFAAVGSMDADADVAEQDGELVLKATGTFGNVNAAVSYEIEDVAGTADTSGNMSFGASADLGEVTASVAFQSGEANTLTTAAQSEILGVKVATSMGGADLALGYVDDRTADLQSTGISVTYPAGAVTVAASYVMEDNAAGTADDNWDITISYAEGAMTASVKTDEADDWAVEGTYDMGNGLTVAGGVADAGDDFYIGGSYDLGGGAALLVSYADDSDGDEVAGDNDIGAAGYAVGTTVELSFAF